MEVPAVDDPRVQVQIPVPVKGRKTPIVLRLPRFDFIDEATHDEMQAALAAAENGDDPDVVPRKRARLARLAMLKPFVPAKDYAVCEGLTIGQLDAIVLEWQEKSSIPLGEYLASVASSTTTSTEAPSATTSTLEDGPAATSDAA